MTRQLLVSDPDLRLPHTRRRGATEPSPRVLVGLLCLLALPWGCGPESPDASGGRETAGTRPSSLETVRVPDSLDALPELLGEREFTVGGFPPDLGPIHWLGVGSSGTLAVTQYQDHLVRILDASGDQLAAVGGPDGEAGVQPGRLRSQGGGGWIGDTLWVNVRALGRIALHSSSGELLRTLSPMAAARPVAGEEDRFPTFLTVWPLVLYPGDTLLVLAGDASGRAEGGGSPQEQDLLRVLPGGGILRGVLRVEEPEAGGFFGRGGGRQEAIPESGSLGFHHVGPRGDRIAALEPDPARSQGGTWRLRVLDALGSPVLEKEMAFPEGVEPDAVVEGADHRTWIRLGDSAGGTWLVLDQEGHPWGRVSLPDGSRLLEAGEDYAWVSKPDETGGVVLVRYRIAGPG